MVTLKEQPSPEEANGAVEIREIDVTEELEEIIRLAQKILRKRTKAFKLD